MKIEFFLDHPGSSPGIQRAQRVFTKGRAQLLAFVPDQYVTQGINQLDADKLTPLLKLRYPALNDAMAELGDAVQVRQAFVGMQRYLQQMQAAHPETPTS